jgi:uncharacterized protein
MGKLATAYRASYYNFYVPNDQDQLVFNGVTSALLKLPSPLFEQLKPYLGNNRDRKAGEGFRSWEPPVFYADTLPPEISGILPALTEAGIFIPADDNERLALQTSYKAYRTHAPFFVTITTTLDCNMRCYYCYQKDGELESMSTAICDSIIGWSKSEIEKHGYKRIYVDWYGGEPMLNKGVIEQYSRALIPYCDDNGVIYKASMICNGTAWPADPQKFIEENRIMSIQFSLDGPEQHHNKRRGLLKNAKDATGRTASFDEVINTIDSLVGHTKIYLRINVDPWIGRECLDVLDLFARKGWLEPDTKIYPYVAIINTMTEHCGFIGKSEKFRAFDTEFDEIQREFYSMLRQYRDEKSFEVVQYFPNRVKINCAAVSDNAVTFGPNGLMYKCGLDVGDAHRAHDSITGLNEEPSETQRLSPDRWDKYDPFTHPRCSECQYLPICMGGCPKAQIERDESQIRAQSAFWENNFDRIIREYYAATGHA